MKKGIIQNVVFCLAALAFLLLVWQIAFTVTKNEYVIPSVWDCVTRAFSLLGESLFWVTFFSTFLRCLIAFLLSFICAVILALIAYLLPWFSKFFTPIVSLMRSLPTMAIVLILFVLTTRSKAPVIVAFLTLFPMLYTSIYASLCEVDTSLVQMSKVYQVPLKKQILSLYFPSVCPSLILNASAALSHSLKVVVSAEILSYTYQSLGGLMQEMSLIEEKPTLFALVLIVFVTGLIIEMLGNVLAGCLRRKLK